MIKKMFFLQNEYILKNDLYFMCNTNIFCMKIYFSNETYIFLHFHLYLFPYKIILSANNVYFVKNIFLQKKNNFLPYKNIFSANNVYFVKNIFLQKKIFFFNLVLQQMNNHNRALEI